MQSVGVPSPADGRGRVIDWDKLRVFHAVAEAGSFTHAGDTLNLSQSEIGDRLGVSQMQVSRLLRRALGLLRSRLTGAVPAPEASPVRRGAGG